MKTLKTLMAVAILVTMTQAAFSDVTLEKPDFTGAQVLMFGSCFHRYAKYDCALVSLDHVRYVLMRDKKRELVVVYKLFYFQSGKVEKTELFWERKGEYI